MNKKRVRIKSFFGLSIVMYINKTFKSSKYGLVTATLESGEFVYVLTLDKVLTKSEVELLLSKLSFPFDEDYLCQTTSPTVWAIL